MLVSINRRKVRDDEDIVYENRSHFVLECFNKCYFIIRAKGTRYNQIKKNHDTLIFLLVLNFIGNTNQVSRKYIGLIMHATLLFVIQISDIKPN